MPTINALPASVSSAVTSTASYSMANLVNTTTVSKYRTIQSIALFSQETTDTTYEILFGTRVVFRVPLKQYETFTVDGLKFTQQGDVTGTTNNDATKITCRVLSGQTRTTGANVVISYTDITVTN